MQEHAGVRRSAQEGSGVRTNREMSWTLLLDSVSSMDAKWTVDRGGIAYVLSSA